MKRLALVFLVLAGCGGESGAPTSTTPPTPAAGAPIPGGGLTIAEAKTSDLDGPLMVVGHLAERNGELRLCDGLRESDPPQCVDPSLRIEGETDGGIGERVSLLGDVDGDVLRISETARG